jgi:hypothetical protein
MLAMKCITRQILYHFYTLFLFTKSDTTLVVIPMVSLLYTAYLPYLFNTYLAAHGGHGPRRSYRLVFVRHCIRVV